LDRRTEVVIDEADGEPEDPEGDVEGDELVDDRAGYDEDAEEF
jgi:hypothetical protein